MKIFYKIIIIVSLITSHLYCQTIINGDFEINSLSTCLINPTNSVYNSSISNSWSFGNNSYSGIDLQKNSCGYASSPSNLWFASLAKNYIPGVGWGNDELSLEIDLNLIAGNMYQISYYDYSSALFGNNLIPLEIGLSLDSLTFGDSIYGSAPSINNWTLKSFLFVAPNNGKYLTIRNENTSALTGWNFVDNFQFNSSTGISNKENINECSLFPNPFENYFFVKTNNNEQLQIILYDISFRNLLQQTFTNSTSVNTDHLVKGMYLYEVRNNNEIITRGKIIKK